MRNKTFIIIAVVAVFTVIGFSVGYCIGQVTADLDAQSKDTTSSQNSLSDGSEISAEISEESKDRSPSKEVEYCYSDPYYETASVTFYAKILDVNGTYFHVEGLEVNDINHRSEYTFTISDETRLYWNGIVPSLEDFDVGDNISITFDGIVFETFPGQISNVEIIKLLDDER